MIILLSLSYISIPTASANENEEEGVSELFTNFIEKAYENLDGLNVLDVHNNDVTDHFIATTQGLYKNKDYKGIQNVLINEGLDLSYDIIKQVKNPGNQRSNLVTESKTSQFYHLKKETTLNRYQKEWTTTLSGSQTFNRDTNKTVSATNPILKVNANFGATFSSHVNNISTKSTIVGNSVKYSASYTMNGTLSIPLGNLPIGYKLNFGKHTNSFTGYPSTLQ